MQCLSGQYEKKNGWIILHGGAGSEDPKGEFLISAKEELKRISLLLMKEEKNSGTYFVTKALEHLENSEMFNAGFGAALQADGQARVSASIMSGPEQKFSAVINATYLKNPSHLALTLQDRSARVVTNPGVELLARQEKINPEWALTEARVDRWVSEIKKRESYLFDTVGCVLALPDGKLYSGTSTGGRGFEFPGRVSDCVTVAGNYATKFLATSCTGHGEEIVDDALSARLETRVRDGMTLKTANEKTFYEAKELQRSYGWISVSQSEWAISHVTPSMTYLMFDLQGKILF